MSETIPLTTQAIVSLSNAAGVDPKYSLAAYSAVLGAVTGGIGWGLGAAISGGLTSFGTSLAMDTGEGRQLTRKVAKEFFMDVVGMSPQAAYTAASITVSTGIAIAISSIGNATRNLYKQFVGYDATWKPGGAAVEKAPFERPHAGANNVSAATQNLNPNSLAGKLWHHMAEEGGVVSKILNQLPGVNAFSGHHDTLMIHIGRASGSMRALTTGVFGILNFPTMAVPSLPMTYAALLPQTHTMTISSYAAALGQWRGPSNLDENY